MFLLAASFLFSNYCSKSGSSSTELDTKAILTTSSSSFALDALLKLNKACLDQKFVVVNGQPEDTMNIRIAAKAFGTVR